VGAVTISVLKKLFLHF